MRDRRGESGHDNKIILYFTYYFFDLVAVPLKNEYMTTATNVLPPSVSPRAEVQREAVCNETGGRKEQSGVLESTISNEKKTTTRTLYQHKRCIRLCIEGGL